MKKEKRDSLLSEIIHIKYEQARRRRALRILNKQEWSVEFMEYLVAHAAKDLGKKIEIEIESPAGHKLRIKSVEADYSAAADDDIFNRLDDNAAVERFIRDHSRR